MKNEIGGYGDNERDKKLFDLAYGKAYEDGHHSGFNEIYNYLLDYDDLNSTSIGNYQNHKIMY